MNRNRHSIELLESRIAPAGVTVQGKMAVWTDWDGDIVTMKWTGANAPNFTHNHAAPGAVTDGIIFDEIILANAGDAITISVKAGAGGDGRVDLGYIKATGLALKSFSAPKASVLEIDCGDTTNAIGTLKIAGVGTVSPTAFTAPGGDGTSRLSGNIGTVKIAGDFAYGELDLGQSSTSRIGSVSVGGNLDGDVADPALIGAFLNVRSPVGLVAIGHNVIGGPKQHSAEIYVANKYGSITIGGDIIGGTGSGSVSGVLVVDSALRDSGTITIHGSVIGGSHEFNGAVFVRSVKTLSIGGDLLGGTNGHTGVVFVTSSSASITVKGSVIGGAVNNPSEDAPTGAIEIVGGTVGGGVCHVTIGHNLIAGSVTNSGANTNTVTFNGAVVIDGLTNLGSLAVGGSIEGSDLFRAFVLVQGQTPTKPGNFAAIGKLTVGGNVDYAVIAAGQDYLDSDGAGPGGNNLGMADNPDAGIGPVTIGGNYWHSSLMAGVNDNNSLGVGHTGSDTQSIGDATRFAVLGPIVIKGSVNDDYGSSGVSGFEAEQIAKITVGGATMFKHGDPLKYFDFPQFVFAQEIAAI